MQHVLHSRIVSSEQLQAAEAEQALLQAASGETLALSQVLVKQGVLTHAILENVEKSMQSGALLPDRAGVTEADRPDHGGDHGDDAPETAPKNVIGQFRLVRKLGEGGMGAVYLADDTVANRQVAIKLLPKRYAGNADFLSRFRREAKSAGQLNHPNIVAAYSTGEDKGTHYYVMEYCDGEPLDKLLKRSKRLPWDVAVEYTLQVARGLKHAHDNHIVHRDIKPGNIFITSEGVAKILDMGLSKNIRDSEQSFNTVSGTALGTPHYISPEQAKGEREIDGRTDIYSLGGTLYHLVTGETPFQGATPAMVMMKHLNEQLSNPQDLCEEVPDGIVQVIRKMMAKEPDDRYANCAQLIGDLECVTQGKLPVNADVAVDKTSIGMRSVKTGVDASQNRKGAGMRSPVARKLATPANRAGSTGLSGGPFYAAIGAGAAALALVAVFVFGGKPPATNTLKASGTDGARESSSPRPTLAMKTSSAPVDATLLFQEDFKALDFDAARPGLTYVSREKLSVEDVPGHGRALKVALTHADSGNQAGVNVSIDIKKARGRTILATVQAYCPQGFAPFHDANFDRPVLESILEDRSGKTFDTATFLQSDDREWKQLVRIVKVPDDAKSLHFAIKLMDAEGEVFFDDFKVEIVPEGKPASVASTAGDPSALNGPEELARREANKLRKKALDDVRHKADIAANAANLVEAWPLQNMYVGLDLSAACNADVISTATHEAADSFKADIASSWTTLSWLKAKDKKEKKDSGLPDEGYIRIPKALPTGFFKLSMPPAKSAIMLTSSKGRYPKPVTVQLPPTQRDTYAQLAFLHGGSWGDGRVKVAMHYSTGKDTVIWLKIEDWHPQFRLPLEQRESVAAATITTHDKPAEMCAQTFAIDGARVLESLTFSFDPINAPAAEEVPHDDRFSAGIFAVSALPAVKPRLEPAPRDAQKGNAKKTAARINPSGNTTAR